MPILAPKENKSVFVVYCHFIQNRWIIFKSTTNHCINSQSLFFFLWSISICQTFCISKIFLLSSRFYVIFCGWLIHIFMVFRKGQPLDLPCDLWKFDLKNIFYMWKCGRDNGKCTICVHIILIVCFCGLQIVERTLIK